MSLRLLLLNSCLDLNSHQDQDPACVSVKTGVSVLSGSLHSRGLRPDHPGLSGLKMGRNNDSESFQSCFHFGFHIPANTGQRFSKRSRTKEQLPFPGVLFKKLVDALS